MRSWGALGAFLGALGRSLVVPWTLLGQSGANIVPKLCQNGAPAPPVSARTRMLDTRCFDWPDGDAFSEGVHPTKGAFRRPWPMVPFCSTVACAFALPPESKVPIPLRVPDFGFDDDDAEPALPPVGALSGDH